jgi:hypothetical protein
MIDEVFIKTILQKGKEAKEKVQSGFSDISLQQLNWKPLPETWSIAQCLEHLAGNIELMSALRALLERHEYPSESQKFVHIGFESQETVDRESKGNWYYHFK